MKIALCLSGHLRTYDKTYESLYEQLLNKHDCDVFVSTWKNLGNKFAYHCAYKDGADQGDDIVEVDTIQKMYNPISIHMDDADTEEISGGLKKQYEGLATRNGAKMSQIMCMLYKIWDANELKAKHEDKNNFKYDVVVRCRFDVYLKRINLEMAMERTQFIPGHLGMNDFIFAGSSKNIEDVCDIYTVMSPDVPFNQFENVEQLWNTHVVNNEIPHHTSDEGIEFLRYAAAGIYDRHGTRFGDLPR